MAPLIRSFSLAVFLVLAINSVGQQKPISSVVKLRGTLLNFAEKVQLEDFSAIQRIKSASSNAVITLAADSSFSISLSLSKPCYYRLGRNILYLSPGDDLDLIIDRDDSKKASFKGKGAAANMFLRNNLFPKGGSFLEAGRLVFPSPKSTFDSINILSSKKFEEISRLKGVSQEFVRLEKARLKADLLKTYKAFSSYSYAVLRNKTEQEKKAYFEEFNLLISAQRDTLLKNFVDPSFLQLEVYRDIYSLLNLEDPTLNKEKVNLMKDWYRSLSLSGKLNSLTDKSVISGMKPSIDSIFTKSSREALISLYEEKLKFGNGDLAIDFTVVDDKGVKMKLSDLRGKVIYLDLWATWCGPCMAEMPNLELLKKKYSNESQLAIVSLSIDDTDKVWLDNLQKRDPGGIQWRTIRENLKDYGIVSIPRYIVINKDFRIANLNAEKPSSALTIKELDKLIASKK
jgi:thiol-disulfide isomerase/thioredoxin